jgi:hypothetical protein
MSRGKAPVTHNDTKCIVLNVIYAECCKHAHYAQCLYAECRYAKCRGAKYQPLIQLIFVLTCGILKSLSKFATCMEVTLEAAPTTPEMTLFLTSGEDPSRHL